MNKVAGGNIALVILFIFLFPNLSILGLDNIGSQPNSIILAVLALPFLNIKRLPLNLTVLLIIAIPAILLIVYSPLNMTTFRSLTNYCSLAFVPLAVYKLLHFLTVEQFKKLLKVGIWIWCFVAIIQLFFNPNFLSFLLPHQSGSLVAGRGVTSLATEPTYYGYYICLFISLVLVFFKRKEKIIYITLLLIQLLFFSISTTAIITIIVSIFLYAFIASNKARMFILGSGVITLFLFYYIFYIDTSLLNSSLKNIRLVGFIQSVLENPTNVLILDGSGNRRFLGIFLSFRGAMDSFFIPNGYDNFNAYVFSNGVKMRYGYLMSFLKAYPRILSSVGGILFELGLFGIISLIAILSPFLKLKSPHSKLSMIIFFMILLNPVPFTNSIVHLIIGATSCLAFNKFKKT